MPVKWDRNSHRGAAYQIRILVGTCVSLLIVIAFFVFWPLPGEYEPADINYDIRGQELIAIEDIQQTRHEVRKPPPPAPMTPVVVPDDVILDEIEFAAEDNMLTVEDPGDDEELIEGPPQGTNLSMRADSGPKPFRIVEPEYSKEARKKKIRAEVLVEVLVDERGNVAEARVLKRYLVNKDKTERQFVTKVGYGIEEAALAAAQRWMFRPAREGGKIVRSYTTLTFSFGV